MTYENGSEASGHEGVSITRLPLGRSDGGRYKVSIACLEGEWVETYGSLAEIRAFFDGIKAAQTMRQWLGAIEIPKTQHLRCYAADNENENEP